MAHLIVVAVVSVPAAKRSPINDSNCSAVKKTTTEKYIKSSISIAEEQRIYPKFVDCGAKYIYFISASCSVCAYCLPLANTSTPPAFC